MNSDDLTPRGDDAPDSSDDMQTKDIADWGDWVGAPTTFSIAARQVVGRAATEPEYLRLLLDRPHEALAGFEVTAREETMLSALDRRHFATMVENLKVELESVGTRLLEMERRIVEVAESWEASLIEMDREDEDLPEDAGEARGADV